MEYTVWVHRREWFVCFFPALTDTRFRNESMTVHILFLEYVYME